ncbi:hypothetical protein KAJ83_10390 [Marivibrio halodurans]|uniref:Uncharacterized protein n=1 Tax=Marivibrio halodurans TaxID=2039722 RepID=A0A8J7V144_9PROT|nr:hypothetical protein [Marivibrio halodurans]MBP5857416.1 hypothetical protein [Marivibrio halodurans]
MKNTPLTQIKNKRIYMTIVFLASLSSIFAAPKIVSEISDLGILAKSIGIEDYIEIIVGVFILLIVNAVSGFVFNKIIYSSDDELIALAIEYNNEKMLHEIRDILSQGSFMKVGDSLSVIEDIISEVGDARCVKNTFVTFSDDENYENEVVKIYDHCFNNPEFTVWKDLISYPEVFSSRFEMPLSVGKVSDRHHVRILRHNVPLINFMIIFKQSGENIAYVGWVHQQSVKSPIFATRNKAFIDYLNRHYDSLWRRKVFDQLFQSNRNQTIVVDYSKNPGERLSGTNLVKKFGLWVIMSYYFDDDENFLVKKFDLIQIFLNDGQLKIEGVSDRIPKSVSSEDGTKELLGIEIRNLFQTANRLYFEYHSGRLLEIEKGYCLYRFERYERIDAILGYVTNDHTGTQHRVVGVRADQSILDGKSSIVADADKKRCQALAERRYNRALGSVVQ